MQHDVNELAITNVHSNSMRGMSAKNSTRIENKPLSTHERLKSAILRHR